MKCSVGFGLGLVVVSSLFAFAGCGDDDDGGPGAGGEAAHGGATSHGGAATHGGAAGHAGEAHGHGGDARAALECKVLGQLCHEADSGTGTAHECHETGHQGKADACAQEFAGCIAFCTGDGAGSGGAGGSGPAEDAHCAALGELCHLADADGPVQACHELGHVNNAAQCAAAFDDCAKLCLAARAELQAGAGGNSTGGVSSGGGAGGAR